MTAFAIGRPTPNEYSEYHKLYVSKVPDGEIMTILRNQLDEAVKRFEAQHLERMLRACPDKREAARRLGIGLSSLYRKIEQYGLGGE